MVGLSNTNSGFIDFLSPASLVCRQGSVTQASLEGLAMAIALCLDI